MADILCSGLHVRANEWFPIDRSLARANFGGRCLAGRFQVKMTAAVFGIASALLTLAGGKVFAQEARYVGEWTGKYVCGQGVTAIRLVVVPTGAGGAQAVAHFFATPENPRVPEGC